MKPLPQLSEINRLPERAVPDEAPAILAEGLVAHVGFCINGQPLVIPMNYQYDAADPDRLYVHGSLDSRACQVLAGGAPVCITVTIAGELVSSREAAHHAMNYRSVVLFGHGHAVSDNVEKETVLEKMIARYWPGRTVGRDYDAAPAESLDGTAVICVEIEEWSAKARR